ncbi:hypothetical protein KAZ01_04045 [Candidatus Gracilibacteria bacterium]|nr:hypothetical protein [Candidatus Gracilibacteria bacterium]
MNKNGIDNSIGNKVLEPLELNYNFVKVKKITLLKTEEILLKKEETILDSYTKSGNPKLIKYAYDRLKQILDQIIGKPTEEMSQKESSNKVPQLENTYLHIESDSSWKEKIINGVKIKTNGKGVWEYLEDNPDGEKIKGEQIFTQQAAIEAAEKQGKKLPSKEQLGQIILAINPNVKLNGGWQDDNTVPSIREKLGIKFTGHRSPGGYFYGQGKHGGIWLSDKNTYAQFAENKFFPSYEDPSSYAFSVLCLKD